MPDTVSLDALLAYCTDDNRVCPVPRDWNTLWSSLPGRARKGSGWEPSLPLILAAWYEATDQQKRERLAEHIRWADTHGGLEAADQFLRSLPDDRWHKRPS